MDYLTVKDLKLGWMSPNMKEIGRMELKMVRENLCGEMVANTRVIL